MRMGALTGKIDVGAAARFALALAVVILPLSSNADVSDPPGSRTPADRQCLNNLRTIYVLIEYDLHVSGGALGFPSLNRLYGAAADPRIFVCPTDRGLEATGKPGTLRTSYEIVSNPLDPKLAATPARRVAVVAEKRASHKANGSCCSTMDRLGPSTIRNSKDFSAIHSSIGGTSLGWGVRGNGGIPVSSPSA
jgi:hypothetical protein